jgi:hypothetical protein
MVMRDPNIRTEISPFKERETFERARRDGQGYWQEDFILMEDVVFVDLDEGSRSAKGTRKTATTPFKKAWTTPMENRMCMSNDASSAYRENVDLAPGVTSGAAMSDSGYERQVLRQRHPSDCGWTQSGPTFTMADKSTLPDPRCQYRPGGGPLMSTLPVVGDTDISRIGVMGNNANKYSILCNVIEDNREGVL